jgi:predicted transcriptional regulator
MEVKIKGKHNTRWNSGRLSYILRKVLNITSTEMVVYQHFIDYVNDDNIDGTPENFWITLTTEQEVANYCNISISSAGRAIRTLLQHGLLTRKKVGKKGTRSVFKLVLVDTLLEKYKTEINQFFEMLDTYETTKRGVVDMLVFTLKCQIATLKLDNTSN